MQASRLTLAYEDDMDVAELPNIPNYTALHNSFAPEAVGGHVPASDTDTDGLCIRDEHDTRPPHAKPHKPLKNLNCRAPQS